jgi:hypothetical protein
MAAALIAALAIAGVAWYVAFGDLAHPFARRAPTSGSVEVGVEYRISFSCGFPTFRLGDDVWGFSEAAKTRDWPPELPDNGWAPYPVPGSLTLSSPTQGVFVADVDGSRLEVTRIEPYRDIHQLGPMCI